MTSQPPNDPHEFRYAVNYELVLGLLVLLCLAFDVQAAPLMWVFEEGWWGGGGYVAAGIVLAQPALLALWAVLGPRRAAIQWPRAMLLLILIWWADTLGARSGWRPAPPAPDRNVWMGAVDATALDRPIDLENMCLVAGVFFGLFLLVQLPLLVARHVWSWRVSRPAGSSRYARGQFSLRRVFAWTTLVAVLLAASRYLLRHQTWSFSDLPRWREAAFEISYVTRALSPVLLPAIPLAGLVLGQRRRGVFLLAAVVGAVGGAFASVALIAEENASVRLQNGCFEELGFCGATLAALCVVRGLGFRLAPFGRCS
ncbi:MAG TPA: hypothetical protein VMV69_06675 [Pirellulales bacterium]|nr:hypothetical protein [Pirellulales bacterium]